MAAVIQHPAAYGAQPEDWAHFDMLLGLTEDLLPVVSNPKATISGRSSMRDLGKVPSIYNEQRQAVGFTGWTQHRSSPADIARWSRERDYGICLQTRRVRAIDVDVADVDLAQQIHAASCRRTGALRRGARAATRRSSCWPSSCPASSPSASSRPRTASWSSSRPASSSSRWARTPRACATTGTAGACPTPSRARTGAVRGSVGAPGGHLRHRGVIDQQRSVKGQKLADVIANDPVAQFLLNTNRSSAPSATAACTSRAPSSSSTPRVGRQRHHLLPRAHGRLRERPLPVPARALRAPQRPGVPRCDQLLPREPRQRVRSNRRRQRSARGSRTCEWGA
jgi:hypothetical protein